MLVNRNAISKRKAIKPYAQGFGLNWDYRLSVTRASAAWGFFMSRGVPVWFSMV